MTVYLLQATNGGPIKIGCSYQPSVRASALNTLFPYGVELLCQFPGERHTEAFLHQCFDPLRITNEWFQSVPALWRLVIDIVDNGTPSWLPSAERWDQERAQAEAVRLFGSLQEAKAALGYATATPTQQVFSITSSSSYSVQSRLSFRSALASGALPTYVSELHYQPSDLARAS